MTAKGKSNKELLGEIEELKERLAEAEEILHAIRHGEVDGILGDSSVGGQIYTLQGAEHPYRVFFEAMNEGAITTTFEGTILYSNGRFAKFVEIPLEKVIGLSFLDLVVEDSRPAVAAVFSERVREGRVVETCLRRREGRVLPVNISLSTFKTTGLEAVCVVVTDLSEHILTQKVAATNEILVTRNNELKASQDALRASEVRLRESSQAALDLMEEALMARQSAEEVSEKLQHEVDERRSAERTIRSLNEQLCRKLEELEAVNKELEGFTYSVSHDLRAPIRHIAGFTQLLEKRLGSELNEEGSKFLTYITGAAARLGVLTDELLEYSRMGRREIGRAEVALGPLVAQVVEVFSKMDTGRQIVWQVGELPVVRGDATMLRFVVENLVANAVKFTSTREEARIEIGASEDDRNQIIFVRDNGVGFDMAFYDKLFGVFQRLHRQEEFAGTGIGLANVQRIISRHGGKVWAVGQPDAGATFTFSLPKEMQR